MDGIKEANYLRDHPGGRFPDVEMLAPEEVRALRDRLSTMLALDGSFDGAQVVATIRARSAVLEGCDANDVSFSVRRALHDRGIHPLATVYLNWSRLESVDGMLLADLDDSFPYIWYPSSDDLEIFDAALQWILSVTHDGSVMILTRGDGGSSAPAK